MRQLPGVVVVPGEAILCAASYRRGFGLSKVEAVVEVNFMSCLDHEIRGEAKS